MIETADAEAPASCDHETVLVRLGTVVSVTVLGASPHMATFRLDMIEPAIARCVECLETLHAAQDPAWTSADLDRVGSGGLSAGLAAARRWASHCYRLSYGGSAEHVRSLEAGAHSPCGCGFSPVSAVFYGDACLKLARGVLRVQSFSAEIGPDEPVRWECPRRGWSGLCSDDLLAAQTRAAAEANARAFLGRVPRLQVGGGTMPEGAWSGWPERPRRAREGDPFVEPVEGMTFAPEGWLDRAADGVWHSACVAAGMHPAELRARYPKHRVRARLGRGRQWCSGGRRSTWSEIAMAPTQTAEWARAGVWPCCASRFASASLAPADAKRWIDAGFDNQREAAAWTRAGIGIDEAIEWAEHGLPDASVVTAWKAAGLRAADALRWSWLWGGRRRRSRHASPVSPEPEHLAQLQAWQTAGLSPSEAKAWHLAGMTPADARLLPPGHPHRPGPAALQVLAALQS
jgi:hypothetical protein